MVKSCLLIGGDNRHRIMAKLLTEKGVKVYCYGMENCINLTEKAVQVDKVLPTDLTVLPIPVSRDGIHVNAHYASGEISLEHLLSELHADTVVCGGLIPDTMGQELERRGITYYDYGKQEAFALQNAVPSAEGAIEIALRNTPFTLEGAKVCVVGYGRIGKILTKKLLGLDCHVTTTARKEKDLKAINSTSAKAIRTDKLASEGRFDVIFNTVPAPVIHQKVLDAQSPSTLIIDLASKPGGVDFDYAQSKKIHCIHALSLPARCAPVTATKITLSIIKQLLSEMD